MYATFYTILKNLPAWGQWIFSFALPMMRELNCRIQTKIVKRIIDPKDEFADVRTTLMANIGHSTSLAVVQPYIHACAHPVIHSVIHPVTVGP